MNENHLISHKIRIQGESYPVKLTEEEKIIAQQIEAEINDKIHEYRIKYAVSSTKDILSMLLLTYAFELHAYKTGHSEDQIARIKKLADMITEQIDL